MNAITSGAQLLPSTELKEYSGVALRIMKLLANNCTQEQAAKAVGVTPGYVSQLCGENDFQIQLAGLIKKGIEQAITIDETYVDIEAKLVARLKELIPMVTTADSTLKILKFVNEAKKKTQIGVPATDNQGGINKTDSGPVRLVLPLVIKQTFVVNPNNEVVEVESRNLVTLNSNSIQTLAKQHEEAKRKQVTNHGQQRSKEDPFADL